MSDTRHQVLVVGVGSIGERHLRCFQATGRADVSLVEIKDELRCRIADRYKVRQAFSDLESALEIRPDAAVIATPAPAHVPLALRLVEAGIHVLIEKPLSTTLDGVPALSLAVRDRRVAAAVAYVYRCHPLLIGMRSAIRTERFGKPVELIAVTGQHFPTYRPAYRHTYFNDRSSGGGAIQDALTHIVNAGEWLLGPVSRLVADAGHQVLDDVTVEDTVHLLARHDSVMASYNLNMYQAPNEVTITVVCEKGTVRVEFHENRWRWMTQPAGPWTDEVIPPMDRDHIFIAQANAFLNAVEGKAPVPCTLDDGIQTLRVNRAALASLEQGMWQTISQDLD
jgi:predicted dehydrogenase